MSSIAVCRPLVGMLCVKLCSTVVCGLLLVSSVLFLELLLVCSSPFLLPQEVCCCSCLPVQVHSSLLCWWCCVLFVKEAGDTELLRKSCLLLSPLQEDVAHPRRPDVGAALLRVVNSRGLLLIAGNQAAVAHLLDFVCQAFRELLRSSTALLCWASKRFHLICCRTHLVDTCGDRLLLLLHVEVLLKCLGFVRSSCCSDSVLEVVWVRCRLVCLEKWRALRTLLLRCVLALLFLCSFVVPASKYLCVLLCTHFVASSAVYFLVKTLRCHLLV